MLVEIWIQGSEQKQHFELTIGTDRGLVALDNKDRWGVDIFESVYKSVNIPKGGSIATLYPAFWMWQQLMTTLAALHFMQHL